MKKYLILAVLAATIMAWTQVTARDEVQYKSYLPHVQNAMPTNIPGAPMR